MNRTFGIIVSTVVWCALVAYLIFAAQLYVRAQDETVLSDVKIRVLDFDRRQLVSAAKIEEWLREEGFDFAGTDIGSINTEEIRQAIAKHGFVKDVRVYTAMNGVLRIDVTQRRPIARVNTYNGYDFYISDDDLIMPVERGGSVYVPVVTGNFALPFAPGFSGSVPGIGESMELAEQQAQLAMKEQLLAIDRQRRELYKEEQPKVDAYRKKRRKIERKRDEEERRILLEAHEQKEEQRRIIFHAELQKLEQQKAEIYRLERLRVAEQKKEHQKYLYLLKLINFVKLTSKDSFWDAQIVQINVSGKGVSFGGDDGRERWYEPEVVLVPRIGRHIVRLGTLDDASAKLDKLMLFYRRVLDYEGWDAYCEINLKYKGQVVCRR